MQLDYKTDSNGLYVLSRKEINDIAIRVLKEYDRNMLYYPRPFNVDEFAEDSLYLDVYNKYITDDGTIMGMIVFNDIEVEIYDERLNPAKCEFPEGTIVIDMSLYFSGSNGRRRFTLAHECSHWILHRSYYSPDHRSYNFRINPDKYIACRKESVEANTCRTYRQFSVGQWIEWQADSLAAALLMPQRTFVDAFYDTLSREGYRWDYLIYGRDDDIIKEVVGKVAGIFDVSKKAAQIRMLHLDLIKKAW